MRRKEKEIKDRSMIENILREATVCRIGMSQDNVPYIVPMNFGYRGGVIYLHSAKEGKKIDMIKDNPLVCFEVEHKVELIPSEKPCEWGANYYSVIGWGKAEFIDDSKGKEEALNIIMDKYAKESDYNYSQNMLNAVKVIKIQITEMTGKKSGY